MAELRAFSRLPHVQFPPISFGLCHGHLIGSLVTDPRGLDADSGRRSELVRHNFRRNATPFWRANQREESDLFFRGKTFTVKGAIASHSPVA